MIRFLLRLFGKYPVEKFGELTRQKVKIKDMWMPYGYRYWCRCGIELSEGPSGGCSINMVCRKCRINYGCLHGAPLSAPDPF